MGQLAQEDKLKPAVLEQAVDWLVRLNSGEFNDEDHIGLEQWRNACPTHEQAWDRAEKLMAKMGSVPASLAMPSLRHSTDKARRATLKKLLVLMLVTPLGWESWRVIKQQGWTADYHTKIGEQRDIILADGSSLILNTASAVDIYFNEQQRLIYIQQGEIMIHTSKTKAVQHRPFRVVSDQGMMEALGTSFNVRQHAGKTELTVMEGAVRITPKEAKSSEKKVVPAGYKVSFSESSISKKHTIGKSEIVWTNGMVLANDMRLADFVLEINRYRHGFLRCEPSIADIRVSGAFPISDPEKTLNMLVTTYPISMTSRLAGYWTTLLPR